MLTAVTDHPPRQGASSYDCPHCGAYAQQVWFRVKKAEKDGFEDLAVNLAVAVCHACQKRTIWRSHGYAPNVQWELLYPALRTEGPEPHADLPENLVGLYNEARAVLPVSPRAASALVRLTLEGLLSDLYSGSLNDMIGAASAAGLAPEVVQAMDVLRFSGNQSIHEIQSDDTLDNALALFRILNIVVERLITQPKQIRELHDALPDTVREAIDKRNVKAQQG